MGYQVSFNVVQIELPTVILLSAGDDQTIACAQRVDLSGVVNKPENLQGHDILWEQIYGPIVVLDNPNSISTFFVTNNNQDKRFILWIDKGTPKEQFATVWIYYTPTSFGAGSINVRGVSYTSVQVEFLLNLIVDCGSITHTLTSSTTGGNSPSGSPPLIEPNVNVDYSLKISWTVPTSSSVYYPYFLDTQLFYADTDTPASPLFTDLPGSVVTHEFTPDGDTKLTRYYVVTRYNGTDTILSGKSCTVDYSSTTVPDLLHGGAKSDTTGSVSSLLVDRVVFGNIVSRNSSLGLGNTTALIGNTSKFKNILIVTYDLVPISNGSGTVTALSYNVTRFDPSGIGG